MANLAAQNASQHEVYKHKYRISRMNLLLVVIFTMINLVLLITNANSYFLFSAFIPYFITGLGMLLCGRFPSDYYAGGFEDVVFFNDSLFFILLIISVTLTLLYLLAWYMSNKNRVGWIIFALVFFGLDTLGMLLINGISLESLVDILFHAWVIYYLSAGINAHYKLKKLPPEDTTAPFLNQNISQHMENEAEFSEHIFSEIPNSAVIRKADRDAKHKVLLEKRVLYFDICYRRVKHINELVINGNVYAELEGVLEFAHTLEAHIDGHHITAGYAGMHSFISVDGEVVAKKTRLI